MKQIFITGVSTGIGKACLEYFINNGYHVFGTVRSDADAINLSSLYGSKVTILQFDVADHNATANAIKSVKAQLSNFGLVGLINNAGVAVPGPLQHIESDRLQYQLDVNVLSVHRITNLLLPYLGAAEKSIHLPGRIINISSVSGLFNTPFMGAYCISKHALESMSDIYRRELAPFDIKVIAIEPGPIKTEIWKKSYNLLDEFSDTEYGKYLVNANKIIEETDKNAFHVSKVVDAVAKAMNSTNPPTRILVTKNKWMFNIISKVLPDKWVDALVERNMKKADKHRPI